MRTIAVVARKGGSGKSTLAVHLAIAAHLRGRKTVLADADPQRSVSEALKVRAGVGPERVETAGPKLFALQIALERTGADLLVIDTPGGPDHDFSRAMAVADLTLIVVRPTFLDIAGAVSAIDAVRQLHRPALIVFNQAPCPRAGAELSCVRKALDALRFTGLPVSSVIVRSRTVFQSALSSGQSAEERGPSAAADEIAALWRQIDQMIADQSTRAELSGPSRLYPSARVEQAVPVVASHV